VGGEEDAFNHNLGRAFVQIAYEWVKTEPAVLAELKRVVGKLPVPAVGLTNKNKRFLRQFDDPQALRRLVQLPEKLWAEVKRDGKPSFRTLAKAQAALGIAILTYMPLRLENLANLTFDVHLFLRPGVQAISTFGIGQRRGQEQDGARIRYSESRRPDADRVSRAHSAADYRPSSYATVCECRRQAKKRQDRGVSNQILLKTARWHSADAAPVSASKCQNST
jgi:hypothetical protein